MFFRCQLLKINYVFLQDDDFGFNVISYAYVVFYTLYYIIFEYICGFRSIVHIIIYYFFINNNITTIYIHRAYSMAYYYTFSFKLQWAYTYAGFLT